MKTAYGHTWIFLGALLGLTACGGGGGGGDDAGMDAATDGGTDATADGGVDATTDADTDAAVDGGPAGNAYEVYVEGAQGVTQDDCTCNYADEGYDSVEACVADQTDPMEITACATTAIEMADPQVQRYYACQGRALQSYARCVEGLDCADEGRRQMCARDAQTMLEACPSLRDIGAPFGEFLGAVGACVAGDGGSCPDDETASTMTGESVFSGSTIGAGDQIAFVDDGSSECVAGSVSADRIHRWKAPEAGTYRFDTAGSGFDTILRLMSACPDAGGMELACNDDVESLGLQSALERTFAADDEVLVVVEGYSGFDAGDYQVNVTKLVDGCPNDETPSNATGERVFTGTIDAHADDLSAATDRCTGGGAAEVVLRWTAPSDGTWVIDTVGSEFDTVLYVRESCDATTDLACNDDMERGEIASRVEVTATEGQTFFIVVEASSPLATGQYVVNIQEAMSGGMGGSGGGMGGSGGGMGGSGGGMGG